MREFVTFMNPSDHPLFEFDPSQVAVINPSIHRPIEGFPSRAVTCWFGNVVRDRTAGLEPVLDPADDTDEGLVRLQYMHPCG